MFRNFLSFKLLLLVSVLVLWGCSFRKSENKMDVKKVEIEINKNKVILEKKYVNGIGTGGGIGNGGGEFK